jgi:hypothetical protein
LHWLDGKAKSALAGYVASHPIHVVDQFLSESPPMIRSKVLPAGNGRAIDRVPFRPIPPGADIDPFFRGDTKHLWGNDVAVLAGLAVALGIVAGVTRRRPNWPALVVGVSAFAVGVGSLFENWLGSAIEMIRHAVPPVTLLRAGLVIVVVVLGDACLRHAKVEPVDDQTVT